MSNNDGFDFRLGLGSTSSTTYFTAMSNTAERGNTSQQFVNEPYGGIHFNSDDLDFPVDHWKTQLLTASIPHHNKMKDAVAHDIWLKRVQIGGALDPEDKTLYRRLAQEDILFSPSAYKWRYLLDSYPPIRPRPDDAKKIVNHGLVHPLTYPQELEDFMNLTFNYDKSPLYPNTVITMYPMLTIKKLPAAAQSSATSDTFDVILRRNGASSTSTYRNMFTGVLKDNAGGYYQLMRISRTLAILLGIEEWNEHSYFPLSSPPNDADKTVKYLKDYQYLSDFTSMVNISDAEMKQTEKTARDMYPTDNISLKHEGVNAAKMMMCGPSRGFVYNIIARNYDPQTTPYRPALSSSNTGDGKQPWYSGPHVYGSTHRWSTPPTVGDSSAYNLGWDEGQYVDLILCIMIPESHTVEFSSDTYYNDTNLYTSGKGFRVALPQHTSIACKYIPRGVPLYLSYYLRNTQYHHHMVHIRAPNLLYPNTSSGRLESTVDILKTTYQSEIKPWTAQWFQTIRPVAHTVRADLTQNRILFKVDIIHTASTQITLLSNDPMSDEAIKYYADHSKFIMTDDTLAPIGLTFIFHPIFDSST